MSGSEARARASDGLIQDGCKLSCNADDCDSEGCDVTGGGGGFLTREATKAGPAGVYDDDVGSARLFVPGDESVAGVSAIIDGCCKRRLRQDICAVPPQRLMSPQALLDTSPASTSALSTVDVRHTLSPSDLLEGRCRLLSMPRTERCCVSWLGLPTHSSPSKQFAPSPLCHAIAGLGLQAPSAPPSGLSQVSPAATLMESCVADEAIAKPHKRSCAAAGLCWPAAAESLHSAASVDRSAVAYCSGAGFVQFWQIPVASSERRPPNVP